MKKKKKTKEYAPPPTGESLHTETNDTGQYADRLKRGLPAIVR